MAIHGYNTNGDPMFDNPQEYCEWLNKQILQRYNDRNRFQIIHDIQMIIQQMSDTIKTHIFEGTTLKEEDDLRELNKMLQKELEILEMKR